MVRKAAVLLLSLFLLSCNNGGEGSSSGNNLPESNGGRMDIIVVAKESLWQSVAGDQFRKYFSTAQPGLPQPEAMFTVRQIEPKSFNSLLRRSRNIIILEEGQKIIDIAENKWARPQLVITLSGNDKTALAGIIREQQEELINRIRQQEIEVLQRGLSKGAMKNPDVLAQHDVEMKIPKAFELEKEEENLLVFWNRTLQTDQGIIIYFQPLPEEMGAVGADLISLRDSLTELYIRGTRENSYMVTETIMPPQIKTTKIDGAFALETRGLWRTTNDFMGGPFINYTVYDEKNNQIIFMDGFIYSPDTQKRNFILELEAILKTLDIR